MKFLQVSISRPEYSRHKSPAMGRGKFEVEILHFLLNLKLVLNLFPSMLIMLKKSRMPLILQAFFSDWPLFSVSITGVSSPKHGNAQ